eukprot:scaffold143029_cov18-Tisochrysis_lutea.AAC.2
MARQMFEAHLISPDVWKDKVCRERWDGGWHGRACMNCWEDKWAWDKKRQKSQHTFINCPLKAACRLNHVRILHAV